MVVGRQMEWTLGRRLGVVLGDLGLLGGFEPWLELWWF